MRKLVLAFLAVAILGITGCATASKLMAVTTPNAVDQTVSEGEAAIVFVRPTNYGGAVQAPIVKVEADNSISLVGISSAKTKIFYRTTPGNHVFVVGGESGRMLQATLDGGKIYYVKVDPSMGFAKARFSLLPVSQAELAKEGFRKDLGGSEWVMPSSSANVWFLDNKSSLLDKVSIAKEKFQKAKPEDREVIIPQYGVTTPVLPL